MPEQFPPSDGPEVPPLLAGLPHTPLIALQELMLAIVARGICDDDCEYVCSPTFIHHCCYLGLDPDVAFRIKIAYLRNRIGDIDSFFARATSTAPRFDPQDAPVQWSSWF